MIKAYRGLEKGSETLIEEYFYDTVGMRSKKTTYAEGTSKTTYYVHHGNSVLFEVTVTETTKYILVGGREVAKVTGTYTYYTHRDHLGSSSVVTDTNGNVVNWNANRPYGENWQVSPENTPDLDKHRFTGKETDAGTGLVYFGARYYDPEVGRFISTDDYTYLPDDVRIVNGMAIKDNIISQGMQQPQKYNVYVLCTNNPLKYIDPDGHDSIVVNDSANVFGFGHVLILVQEVKEDKFTEYWIVYSTTGDNKEGNRTITGRLSNSVVQDKDKLHSSLKEMGAIVSRKNDMLTTRVKQTVSQTLDTHEYWAKNFDNPYKLAGSNCADQVYKSLIAGGVTAANAAFNSRNYVNENLVPNRAYVDFRLALLGVKY